MKFKVVSEFKDVFEKEINELYENGYWVFGDIKTNIVQDQILYTILMQKI